MGTRLVLLLTILLVGCGDPEDTHPAADVIPAPEPGDFQLMIDGPGLPGRPAPIRIEGDTAGVSVLIRRAAAPVEFYESWFVPVSPLTPPPDWEDAVAVSLDGQTAPRWPVLPPGLYLVTAARGSEAKLELLPVTDLGLVIRRSDHQILVFVVDARTGVAVPGARVAILGPEERRSGRADSNGVFRAAAKPGPEIQVIASSEGRIGVGSHSHILGRQDEDLSFLITDRELCAAGDVVAFAGVVRVRADGLIRPGATDTGRYRVLGTDDEVLAEGDVEPGPAGTFRETFYLPRGVADGSITLSVEFEKILLTRKLEVRRPFPAPFTVTITADRDEPEPEARFPFHIRALLFDGTPLGGAAVTYAVSRGGRANLSGEGVLPETGDLHLSLPAGGEGEIQVEAEVTGPDGLPRSASRRFGVPTDEVGLRIVPESRLLEPDDAAAVRIILPGGGPATGMLRVDEEAHPFRIEAGQTGTRVEFVPLLPGRHPFAVTVRDRNGRQLRASDEVWILDELSFEQPDEIMLVADRDEVREGESIRILLLLPPELAGCSILETVEGRGLSSHRASSHITPQVTRRIQASEWLAGEVMSYRVFAIRDGKLHTSVTRVRVRGGHEELAFTLLEDRGGVAARIAREGGERVHAVVLFSIPGRNGSMSPWLRADADGRTEVWRPPFGAPATVSAVAVGFRGWVGRQTLRIGPAAGDEDHEGSSPVAPRSRPASPPEFEQTETREFDLPPGSSEQWVVIPEGSAPESTTCRIRLTATTRAKLVPEFERLAEMPAGSTLRTLIPLLRFAACEAFGEAWLDALPGCSLAEEQAQRALADLNQLRDGDGSFGHFPGDAPDPRLTDLVERTLRATGLLEGEPSGEEPEFPQRDPDDTTALGQAERCYDLLSEIPSGPSGEPQAALVRVRVNGAIVGTARLVIGKPSKEYWSIRVPTDYLRPGNNLIQFELAGPSGVRSSVTIATPQTGAPRRGPLEIESTFLPRGPVRRGARLTAVVEVRAKVPLRRILIRCPLPDGAKLAAWPKLPDGVAFTERDGGIDLFVRALEGSMKLELPLVVLREGAFEVGPARATLLEQPDAGAQSKGETLLFR